MRKSVRKDNMNKKRIKEEKGERERERERE